MRATVVVEAGVSRHRSRAREVGTRHLLERWPVSSMSVLISCVLSIIVSISYVLSITVLISSVLSITASISYVLSITVWISYAPSITRYKTIV